MELEVDPREAAHANRPWHSAIQVGGFQPFSTIDWPDTLAAVVFLRGCPWRCGYCHNPELQTRIGPAPISWMDVEQQLQRRRGWLDGVVFSGGEPTTDRFLPQAVAHVRQMGFHIGLHTGGAYPLRLAKLLPLLDWVGFDIKADTLNYDSLTGTPGSGENALASATLLLNARIPCQFRMTYHSGMLSADAVLRASATLSDMGVEDFVLQEFRREGVARPDALPAHHGVAANLLAALRERFARFTYRPAC